MNVHDGTSSRSVEWGSESSAAITLCMLAREDKEISGALAKKIFRWWGRWWAEADYACFILNSGIARASSSDNTIELWMD